MLDAIKVLKEARELGSTKMLADVDAALAGYDYPALVTAEKVNYRVELWDKTSPINGIAPEVVGEDMPAGGEVYLIYINDKLVFLQKHDPEQAGLVAMTPTTAIEIAGRIVDQLAEQVVNARIQSAVLRVLL